MQKADILQSIRHYQAHRGWGRYFFGNTKGHETIKRFYQQLPDGELNTQHLHQLFQILQNRRSRLLGRKDDYETRLGKKKLTNVIYLKLGQAVVEAYRKKLTGLGTPQATIDQLLPPHTSIEKLTVLEPMYAFNIDAYLSSITTTGWVNPYTQTPVSPAMLETWQNNSFFGSLIVAMKELLTKIVNTNPGLNNVPVRYVFVSKDKTYSCNLLTLSDQSQNFPKRMIIEMQAFIDNNYFINSNEKAILKRNLQVLGSTSTNHWVVDQNVARQSGEYQFISETGLCFDTALLLQSFTTNGLINPHTLQVFSETDKRALRQHSKAGERFRQLELTWERYKALQLTVSQVPEPLHHLFVTQQGEVINIYQQPKLVEYATRLYLDDKITREEYRAILNQTYNQQEHDINLKRKLTSEREIELANDFIFLHLLNAVQMQSEFSFEMLPSNLFWQLMEKELKLIVGNNISTTQKIRGACSTVYGIKEFDLRKAEHIRRAGRIGRITYPLDNNRDQFGQMQYVVRMPEIYGEQPGLMALTNIVNSFKGCMLTSLRHDMCKQMLDKVDTSGICVGERIRVLNAWRVSLERPYSSTKSLKTILDLLNEYQEELTTSPESRSQLFTGDSAVNFILSRHQGQSFIFKDTQGNEKQGTITRPIIAYYLANFMADDLVTQVPADIPEPFQSLYPATSVNTP